MLSFDRVPICAPLSSRVGQRNKLRSGRPESRKRRGAGRGARGGPRVVPLRLCELALLADHEPPSGLRRRMNYSFLKMNNLINFCKIDSEISGNCAQEFAQFETANFDIYFAFSLEVTRNSDNFHQNQA